MSKLSSVIDTVLEKIGARQSDPIPSESPSTTPPEPQAPADSRLKYSKLIGELYEHA